jgi:hypothetical protein
MDFRLTTNIIEDKMAESELKMEKVKDNMYFQYLKTWGYTCNKMAFRQDLVQ